jgi:hypothetical protein
VIKNTLFKSLVSTAQLLSKERDNGGARWLLDFGRHKRPDLLNDYGFKFRPGATGIESPERILPYAIPGNPSAGHRNENEAYMTEFRKALAERRRKEILAIAEYKRRYPR